LRSTQPTAPTVPTLHLWFPCTNPTVLDRLDPRFADFWGLWGFGGFGGHCFSGSTTQVSKFLF
jgi:hypothetical protein